MNVQEGFGIMLVLLGAATPFVVVAVIYYLKKNLEHRQILAAIEKGAVATELLSTKPRPAGPAWVAYFSLGIGMLIVALGFTVTKQAEYIVAFVFAGLGAGWLIRGLLDRKYFLQRHTAT